ncbi:hypothetical protein F0U60_41460 [Archangium minus]|uniref:Formate/nitrite transporter family protein n=1 Tax=Archangium minus TaxID=83450 RepID=A0ABY9X384_9BACT|nr:hypothetical protein F0U60_41460 [Archangium minus]
MAALIWEDAQAPRVRNTETPTPSLDTVSWKVAPDRELRHLRTLHPSREELQALRQSLGLHQSLLHQLQDPDFAPGAVEFPRQLLVRLNVPETNEEGTLRWERLDVVLTDDAVLTAEARSLRPVEQARARFLRHDPPGGTDRFLAALVEEVVDGFDAIWRTLRKELEGMEAPGPRASAGALVAMGKAQTEMTELLRGLQAARECLAQLAYRGFQRIGKVAAAELLASHDRLKGLTNTVEQVLERISGITEETSSPTEELSAESPEVIDTAIALGERRLHRMTMAHAMTALIGGLAVSFGAVAMAWTAGPWSHVMEHNQVHLLGSLAFPIGFIILLVGKGELFTENFFIPVTGLMSGRGKVRDLLVLWGSTLAFNLVGAVVFAFLVSRPGVIADGAKHFLVQLAHDKVFVPWSTAFMKAVFAGWLMTVLTWLLLAARGQGSRLFIIWMMGFLIAAGHFNHVVISAAEVFMAMGLGAPVSVRQWAWMNFLPALLGNLVGGLVFVTLLGYVQAHSLRRSERRMHDVLRRRGTQH